MNDWSEMINWAQKEWPTTYKLLYPKIYETNGEYYSPQMAAAQIAFGLANLLKDGIPQSATAFRLMLPGVSYMAQHKMPTFFIAPELLRAVQLTDIHEEINWVDLKLPFESAMFMLPHGGFAHPTDGDCAFIIYTRHGPGYFGFPGATSGPQQYYSDHVFSILGFTAGKKIWYHVNLNADFGHTTKLRNLFMEKDGKPRVEPFITPGKDAPIDPVDDPFMESLGVVAFGTLLAMLARPELLEKSTLIRKVPSKKGGEKEFWTPNIIGKHYRMRRELGGSHASPRMHWRRGHCRMQPYGHELSERKRIWLEPCLVCAKSDSEAA